MHVPDTLNEILGSLAGIFCKETEKVFFIFLLAD